MIHIRQAQMDALKAAATESFLYQLAETLHPSAISQGHPQAPPDFRRWVVATAKAAEKLGFRSQDEVTRFVGCALRHGGDFIEQQPWAKAIAQNHSLSLSQKLQAWQAG